MEMETFGYEIVQDWVDECTINGQKVRYPFPPVTNKYGITIQAIRISEAKIVCPEVAKMWLAGQVDDWDK